jgi:hypothetical protein
LQSLCGLLNVPPLLHMKRYVCGIAQRLTHSFWLLAHKSLLSVLMTSPCALARAAHATITTRMAAHPACLLVAMKSSDLRRQGSHNSTGFRATDPINLTTSVLMRSGPQPCPQPPCNQNQ